MMSNRAFKYRIYPSVIQKEKLSQTFGCVRFVYSKCLEEHERRYKAGEKYASRIEMNNYCTRELKVTHPFLRAADKFALTNSIYHLDEAYKRMFRRQGGHPRFNAPADYILKSATVSMERDGSYYVSILYEYQAEVVSDKGNEIVGLDYKSDGLYVSSDGESCGMPHYFQRGQPRLAQAQRKLKHKVKGSNNWEKQRCKIAKVYRHIANQRKDFLHKKSTEIANRYDVVCVENLNMRAMPSSQICSSCGNRKAMSLSERTYKCPHCGAIIDRDLNAAINIRNEGLRLSAW